MTGTDGEKQVAAFGKCLEVTLRMDESYLYDIRRFVLWKLENTLDLAGSPQRAGEGYGPNLRCADTVKAWADALCVIDKVLDKEDRKRWEASDEGKKIMARVAEAKAARAVKEELNP